MKRFDDIFREKVKKTFSSYNADHLAGEGWNSFIAARKTRHRLSVIIPLWARAASVIVIIGIGAFLAYRISTRQLRQEVLTETRPPAIKEMEATLPKEATETEIPVVASMKEPLPRESRVSNQEISEVQQLSVVKDATVAITVPYIDTIHMPFTAESSFLNRAEITETPTEEALKRYPGDVLSATGEVEREKRSGRRTIMAGFSGLMAQTGEMVSSTPGVSVGFYLDQKITKKISVRPGLALAMNSVGLENNSGNTEFNYALPLYDGTNGNLESYNGQLSMLAMELPLNIVFRIFEKNNTGLYLSAGASTMFYLNQQFRADFVNEYTKQSYNNTSGEFSTETRYSTVEVSNDYGAFSRTDLFGLANLSAGYSFPYGKAGTLLIEPFVQLPLNDLTSLNLRVRYGGISMKLRFGSQKSEE